MKTQTNVEIVQQAYADFVAGNIPAILERCTEDVSWGSYENSNVPYAGMFYGKQGVMDFFTTLANAINYTDFSPKEYFSDNERNVVFVRGHHAGTVKITGKTFSHEWLMEFNFKEGKMSSFFAFVDTLDQAQAFTASKENVVRVSLTEKEKAIAHA